jgi:hypothetical protein
MKVEKSVLKESDVEFASTGVVATSRRIIIEKAHRLASQI